MSKIFTTLVFLLSQGHTSFACPPPVARDLVIGRKQIAIQIQSRRAGPTSYVIDDDGLPALLIAASHCFQLDIDLREELDPNANLTCTDEVRSIVTRAAARSQEYTDEILAMRDEFEPADVQKLIASNRRVQAFAAIFRRGPVKVSAFQASLRDLEAAVEGRQHRQTSDPASTDGGESKPLLELMGTMGIILPFPPEERNVRRVRTRCAPRSTMSDEVEYLSRTSWQPAGAEAGAAGSGGGQR